MCAYVLIFSLCSLCNGLTWLVSFLTGGRGALRRTLHPPQLGGGCGRGKGGGQYRSIRGEEGVLRVRRRVWKLREKIINFDKILLSTSTKILAQLTRLQASIGVTCSYSSCKCTHTFISPSSEGWWLLFWSGVLSRGSWWSLCCQRHWELLKWHWSESLCTG